MRSEICRKRVGSASSLVFLIVGPAVRATVSRKRQSGLVKEMDAHISVDISGADSIDLHVVLAPFVAERLGELAESAFGCCIGWDCEAALECQQRAEVNYLSSAEGYHMTSCCLGKKPDGFEVDVQYLGCEQI
jgi:hypothetical protein